METVNLIRGEELFDNERKAIERRLRGNPDLIAYVAARLYGQTESPPVEEGYERGFTGRADI